MQPSISLTSPHHPKDRLVLALDVDDRTAALDLVRDLADLVGLFKIGHQLFTAYGPDLVRRIIDGGGRVFLDLKYHDIPNTVAKASVEAVKLGVSMFNVHAMGGLAMMQAAMTSVQETAAATGLPLPTVLAVTVLTSMDQTALRGELKVHRSLPRTVCHYARLAMRAGLHGVVASPREIPLIRRSVRQPFVVLTPGVRPAWAGTDDQKRVMTPGDAVRAGADYLVVGRPVLKEKDRRRAVQRILEEIEIPSGIGKKGSRR
jgi:orotidine-5'-phosphate decarboxylase